MKIKGVALLVVAAVVLLGMAMRFTTGVWIGIDIFVILVCAAVGIGLLRAK